MTAPRNFLVVVSCSIFLVVTLGVALGGLDDAANQSFAEKARRLQIKGNSEDFVRAHFGPPLFITHSGDSEANRYHVLVYAPGPRWSFPYPSHCKININDTTNVVQGWTMNSD